VSLLHESSHTCMDMCIYIFQVGVHVSRAFELLRAMDEVGGTSIGADIDSFGMKVPPPHTHTSVSLASLYMCLCQPPLDVLKD
jgi:hypothetical protein